MAINDLGLLPRARDARHKRRERRALQQVGVLSLCADVKHKQLCGSPLARAHCSQSCDTTKEELSSVQHSVSSAGKDCPACTACPSPLASQGTFKGPSTGLSKGHPGNFQRASQGTFKGPAVKAGTVPCRPGTREGELQAGSPTPICSAFTSTEPISEFHDLEGLGRVSRRT